MNTPSLAQVLARREARQHRQGEISVKLGLPLISITVVAPGPVKQSERIQRIFDQAAEVVSGRLQPPDFPPPAFREEYTGITGPELLLAVEAEPLKVKAVLVEIENTHAWGRLWDLDVIDLAGTPIPRSAVGAEARRCLICERPSPECARSRRHPVAELVAAIANITAVPG